MRKTIKQLQGESDYWRVKFINEQQRAEAAEAKVEGLNSGILSLIPDCRYMDPPDGGDVTPLEQLSRMVAELRSAPAVSLAELNVRRDAIRYRFLRESDFFGADNEPGLASWDELSELDCNEFDAAVDARMNHPDSLYPIILRNIEEAK